MPLQDLINLLGPFPLLQATVVLLVLAGLGIAWWRANITVKRTDTIVADGNRQATLYDLQSLRADIQNSTSERHAKFFSRFDKVEARLARCEGRLGIWDDPDIR